MISPHLQHKCIKYLKILGINNIRIFAPKTGWPECIVENIPRYNPFGDFYFSSYDNKFLYKHQLYSIPDIQDFQVKATLAKALLDQLQGRLTIRINALSKFCNFPHKKQLFIKLYKLDFEPLYIRD